jgi:DNA-binding transcriptional ArsR family regulator
MEVYMKGGDRVLGINNQLPYYFQILSDSNRLKIISIIGKRELSVSEIVNEMKLSQPLVSHHLRNLKESGILDTKRNGPLVFYRLSNINLLDVLGLFSEVLPKDIVTIDKEPMFMCPPWFKNLFD